MQISVLELWYKALNSRFGIEIAVSDQERVKQKLYVVRKEAGDKTLDSVTVRTPPNKPNHLWLVHNGKSPNARA